MIHGLSSAIYPVRDLAAAKAWYTRVVECDPYFDQPFYVGFSVGGFELGLVPDGTPGTDGVSAYWRVSDAAAEFARLVALGLWRMNRSKMSARGSKSVRYETHSAMCSRSSRIHTSTRSKCRKEVFEVNNESLFTEEPPSQSISWMRFRSSACTCWANSIDSPDEI